MSENKDRKISEEMLDENFPNLLKSINLHILETHRMSSSINAKTYNSQNVERQ